MSRFLLTYEGQTDVITFGSLSAAINYGSRDARGRHFIIYYSFETINRLVYSSREVRSA